MGAPGKAFLCGNGHLIRWIEEHLYWDDDLWAECNKIKADICPYCGNAEIIDIAHYGGINDCICLESEIEEKGIREMGAEEFTVPLKDALDKEGKPVEAYHKIKVPKYFIPDDVKTGKVYQR